MASPAIAGRRLPPCSGSFISEPLLCARLLSLFAYGRQSWAWTHQCAATTELSQAASLGATCSLFPCADQIDEAPPGNLGNEAALIGRHASIHHFPGETLQAWLHGSPSAMDHMFVESRILVLGSFNRRPISSGQKNDEEGTNGESTGPPSDGAFSSKADCSPAQRLQASFGSGC